MPPRAPGPVDKRLQFVEGGHAYEKARSDLVEPALLRVEGQPAASAVNRVVSGVGAFAMTDAIHHEVAFGGNLDRHARYDLCSWRRGSRKRHHQHLSLLAGGLQHPGRGGDPVLCLNAGSANRERPRRQMFRRYLHGIPHDPAPAHLSLEEDERRRVLTAHVVQWDRGIAESGHGSRPQVRQVPGVRLQEVHYRQRMLRDDVEPPLSLAIAERPGQFVVPLLELLRCQGAYLSRGDCEGHGAPAASLCIDPDSLDRRRHQVVVDQAQGALLLPVTGRIEKCSPRRRNLRFPARQPRAGMPAGCCPWPSGTRRRFAGRRPP